MKVNQVIEASVATFTDGADFVVLNDLKRALNLVFDTAGSYEFTDDDTYLGELITQARSVIEEYTGLALSRRTMHVVLRNECGGVELPYGPFITLTSIVDEDGNAITDYTLRGKWFKELVDPLLDYIELIYVTGYSDSDDGTVSPMLPPSLKSAWIAQAVWMYKHRGEESELEICNQAANLCGPYTRKGFIV